MDEKIIKQIMTDSKSVLKKTMEKVNLLLSDTINEKVYKPKSPREYKRSYTFKNAWYVGRSRKSLNVITQKLMYDYKRMAYNGKSYVHGDESKDRRSIMASILEKQETNIQHSDFGGALNVPSDENEGYWEVFKKDLDTKIYKYLDEEYLRYGFRRR